MPDAPEPLHVVFDTNVLISALHLKGAVGDLWDHVEAGTFTISVSPFILREFTDVLKDGFGLPSRTVEELLDEILAHARLVVPRATISVVKAKDADNRILECAVAAGAGVLVTGDLKHLRPIGRFHGIAILTPAEFRRAYLGARG